MTLPFRSLFPPLLVLAGLGCTQGPLGETSNIEIRALNMSLATLAQERKWTYLDTYSIVTGHNGKPLVFFFEPDGEHLSELGYRRWADGLLVPYIKAMKYTKVGMVGDSITRRVQVVQLPGGGDATWKDLLGVEAVNLGADGETTEDVLARLDGIIQPDIQCYFLMIGNNDLHAGVPVSAVVQRVDTLAQAIATRSGKPVVLQAVMPLRF